jgi:GNAT superfamily N-acetyltransferase
MAVRTSKPVLKVVPLTSARWKDFEALFGPRGACGGCWCMTPRLSSAQYEKQKGAGNKRAMKNLVDDGREPGLLGYIGSKCVAWIALGPRSEFGRLERSRVAKPVDERPAWAIVCVYVHPEHRGRKLSKPLIEAAVAHARARGATLVDAFPNEPKKERMPAVFAWAGIASTFRQAGFGEVARRSATRPYMRREVAPREIGRGQTSQKTSRTRVRET